MATAEAPGSHSVTSLSAADYAQAFNVERGRCFRMVDDVEGKPDRCPEPVTVSGSFKVGPKLYQVVSCNDHSEEPRKPSPL